MQYKKILRTELTSFMPVNNIIAAMFLCYQQLLDLHRMQENTTATVPHNNYNKTK